MKNGKRNNVIPMLTNNFTYQLHDFWNRQLYRPWPFAKPLTRGQTFEFDGVEYVVVKKNHEKRWAVIRMTKYKIPNTTSQFVHKCPAKRDHADGLTKADIVKMEKKHGREQTADILNERVKIRAVGAQLEFRCPFCKVMFWREAMELPAPVFIDGVMGKKKLKKRAQAHAN